jgi:hypothetical protein
MQDISTQLQQVNAKLNQLLLDRPTDNPTPSNIHCQTANISYHHSLNKADVHKCYNNLKNDHSTNFRAREPSTSYHTPYYSPAEGSPEERYTDRQMAPENLGQEYHGESIISYNHDCPTHSKVTFSAHNMSSLGQNRPESHADSRPPQPRRARPTSNDSIPGILALDETSRSSILQRLLRLFRL